MPYAHARCLPRATVTAVVAATAAGAFALMPAIAGAAASPQAPPTVSGEPATAESDVDEAALALLKTSADALQSAKSFQAECDINCTYESAAAGTDWRKASTLAAERPGKMRYEVYGLMGDSTSGLWVRQDEPDRFVLSDGTTTWSEDGDGNATSHPAAGSPLQTGMEPWGGFLAGDASPYARIAAMRAAGSPVELKVDGTDSVDDESCTLVSAHYQTGSGGMTVDHQAIWYIGTDHTVRRSVEKIAPLNGPGYSVDAVLHDVRLNKRVDGKLFAYLPPAVRRYQELKSEFKPSLTPDVDASGVALLQKAADSVASVTAWRADTLVEEVSAYPSYENSGLFFHRAGLLIGNRIWRWDTEYGAAPGSDVQRSYITDGPADAVPDTQPGFVSVSDGKTRWTQNGATYTTEPSTARADPTSILGCSLDNLLFNTLTEVRVLGQATVNGKSCDRVYVRLLPIDAGSGVAVSAPQQPGNGAAADSKSFSWSYTFGSAAAGQSYVWYIASDGTPERLDVEDFNGTRIRATTLKRFERLPSLSASDPMFRYDPPQGVVQQ
jgi:outer membrane lipoprotein-sorting protein